MKKQTEPLLAAAERVWDAYLGYGPVDDGRPEGKEFERALDALMEAMVETKRRKDGRRGKEKA